MNTLYLIRGVSGSGKTTLAKTLENSLEDAVAIAADDFWYILGRGEYAFDITELRSAHKWCNETVTWCMEESRKNIILHNTNTSLKEIRPYLKLAEDFNYQVVSLVVENRHGNESVHGVPEPVLGMQAARLRNSIKLI